MDASALLGTGSSLSAHCRVKGAVYRPFRMFESDVIFIKVRG